MANITLMYSQAFRPEEARMSTTLKGKKSIALIENKNPYKNHNVRLPELGTITTNDGVTLNTRMFKPVDFDPSKKYKALLYVYNGTRGAIDNK